MPTIYAGDTTGGATGAGTSSVAWRATATTAGAGSAAGAATSTWSGVGTTGGRARVSGTLQDIFGSGVNQGSVVFQLAGYGGQIPRLAGSALLAKVGQIEIETDEGGAFTVELEPNDAITPAGTYYAVTVKDENGALLQTAAYLIHSSPAQVDLSALDPYDA